MKKMVVELTFVEPILGSTPASQEALRKYIAEKAENPAKTEEEVNSIEDKEDPTLTIFPRTDDGTPFLWDYQIKGFFKSACSALNMANPGSKLVSYRKRIDLLVFIDERRIPYQMPEGSEIGLLTRPLRANTPKGERIALSNSEMLPAGTTVRFTITVLEDTLMKRVRNWLDYGAYNGLGQWRNAKYGTFTWKEVA